MNSFSKFSVWPNLQNLAAPALADKLVQLSFT
jgi:hypothetical protein